MNGKYFVVAGNYQQYKDFTKKKCDELWSQGLEVSYSNFVYATVDSLKGYSNPHGWFYGTWKERADINLILLHLMVATKSDSDSMTTFQKLIGELRKK